MGVPLGRQYERDESSQVQYYYSTRYYDLHYFHKNLQKLERYARPGSILDVGCNVGNFMIAAKSRGWSPVGIEPNTLAASSARREGLEVLDGYFSEDVCRRVKAPLDAVHMGDVIEHVVDPLEFLRLSFMILRPGGVIMIVTPNIDTYFGRRYQVKPMEHPVYFNLHSLSFALEKARFDVLRITRSSRLRDIANMDKSTTEMGSVETVIIKMTRVLGLGKVVSALVGCVTRDEIIAIGQKGVAQERF